MIQVPATGDLNADLATLAGARETLLQITNKRTWTLQWTRDGGLPVVYDCFRAGQPSPKYSVYQDRSILTANIAIQFQALPYGRSDLPQQLSFASPVSGSPAPPPAPVLLDDFNTVTGTYWSRSAASPVSSHAAHWAAPGPRNTAPTYSSTFAATDISGRGVLRLYAGFASARYWWAWGNSPSPVAFAFLLHDSAGRTLSFGTSVSATSSQVLTSPNWYQVSANIPQGTGFNYAALVRVDVTASNFPGALDYTDLWLDYESAQPVTTTAPASVRGNFVTMHGIDGTHSRADKPSG